jgi:glycosyltransferase involved in cell wall biosynthesis
MSKTAILVATYNGEKHLKTQLDSIRDQELPADYVLFRDDQSTDNTVDFIDDYIKENTLQNWQIQVNDKNLGWRLNFRQLLIDGLATDADYFFFSDQDNCWKLDKNRRQIEIMEKRPDIDVLSADIEVEKVSEEAADLPRWFQYYQFADKDQEISKYPLRKEYRSFRVGWTLVMRRDFVSQLTDYWKPDYNITHDVIVPVLASLLGSGYNMNRIVGSHLLHESNATGERLLTLRSSKQTHVDELYKFVGFYDVLYQTLKARQPDSAPEMKNLRDFYIKRHQLAERNVVFPVFRQILSDWALYPGMSGRLRDVIFAFKKKKK